MLFTTEVLRLFASTVCAVDATNANLAAAMCKDLQCWRRLPAPLRDEARAVLEAVRSREGCSKNAAEVCATALRG